MEHRNRIHSLVVGLRAYCCTHSSQIPREREIATHQTDVTEIDLGVGERARIAAAPPHLRAAPIELGGPLQVAERPRLLIAAGRLDAVLTFGLPGAKSLSIIEQ
jgi:hypothetical protein